MREVIRIYLISGHVSLAGLLYGLDTGCVGPITSMTQFTSRFPMSTSIRGLFIAIFLVAAAVASICNGVISDRISRKWTISLGAGVCLVGCAISFTGRSLAQMFAGRIVYGIGTGLALSCCLNYIVEIAPVSLRGQVSCLIQSGITVGAMCGYFITYGTVQIHGDYAWKIPFALQFVVGVVLLVGNFWIPYSPRWLLSKSRDTDAIVVMNYLRGDPIGRQAVPEVDAIHEEVALIKAGIEAEVQNSASYTEIFSKTLRQRSLFTIFLCVIQQAAGIDAILYFSPTIFKSAGLVSLSSSFLASAMSGVTLVLFTLPGFFVDRVGRKKPTLIGGTVMAIAMLTIGICFAARGYRIDEGIELRGKGCQWTVIVMIYVFVAAFSSSWAVVIRTYCCEIIPTRQRSRACALQQYVNVRFDHVAHVSPRLISSVAGELYHRHFCTKLLEGFSECTLLLLRRMLRSWRRRECHLYA